MDIQQLRPWGALALLTLNAWQDLRRREILPRITGLFALVGLLLGMTEEGAFWTYGIGVGLGLSLLGLSLLGGGQVGLGDGFALAVLGLWVPWERAWTSLLVGLGGCALWGGFLLFRHHQRRERLPFLPFLWAGYLVAWLAG